MSNTVTAYSGNEPYVFISYSHKDSNTVLPAIEAMQQQGYRIWFDRGIEAGTEWSNNIAAHLRDCAVFVAFISKNSVKSENCLDEIAFAKSNGKPSLLVFMEEDVVLPEGTEMQTARFQRIYFCRQSSMQSFIQNICSAKILLPCLGAKSNDCSYTAPVKQKETKKPLNKNLLIAIGAAVALIIIICLIIALASKNEAAEDSQAISEQESIAESSNPSNESSAPAEITMSENLYDCTFILEGDVFKLPCKLSAFTEKGWAITSTDYSSDKPINGLATDSFYVTKDGKKVELYIVNQSGNTTRLKDCPVFAISVTARHGASIELAKGITLNSTLSEITSAFGTPHQSDKNERYEAILYSNESTLSAVSFDIYTEEYAEDTCIELLSYNFADEVTTETNEELPDYIADYIAPSELGNDILSGNFKLEEGLYRLPAPVKAFLDNGWSVASAPEFVPAGGKDKIKLIKNQATIEVEVINFADYQTVPENCVVTNLPIYNYDNAKIELPNGITLGMSEAKLDTIVPEAFDKTSSEYSVYYSYSASTPRDLYIYLYIDADKADELSFIRLNSEEWDYGN